MYLALEWLERENTAQRFTGTLSTTCTLKFCLFCNYGDICSPCSYFTGPSVFSKMCEYIVRKLIGKLSRVLDDRKAHALSFFSEIKPLPPRTSKFWPILTNFKSSRKIWYAQRIHWNFVFFTLMGTFVPLESPLWEREYLLSLLFLFRTLI